MAGWILVACTAGLAALGIWLLVGDSKEPEPPSLLSENPLYRELQQRYEQEGNSDE